MTLDMRFFIVFKIMTKIDAKDYSIRRHYIEQIGGKRIVFEKETTILRFHVVWLLSQR